MRTFQDQTGLHWEAEVISHGRTSGYLNPKVHRQVVQFSCLDGRQPRRYAPLPLKAAASLAELPVAELRALLGEARPH